MAGFSVYKKSAGQMSGAVTDISCLFSSDSSRFKEAVHFLKVLFADIAVIESFVMLLGIIKNEKCDPFDPAPG